MPALGAIGRSQTHEERLICAVAHITEALLVSTVKTVPVGTIESGLVALVLIPCICNPSFERRKQVGAGFGRLRLLRVGLLLKIAIGVNR